VPDPVLRIEREGARARVILARPDVRNALDAELIARLHEAFTALGDDASASAIVLQGDGTVFCGGADVRWMRDAMHLSEDENFRDATAFSDMLRAIDRCPKPVIARVQGAALAGGAGLCAVADAVVACDTALFGFTETKLGLIPGVITPFVLAKIGPSNGRRYFLTGERFGAARAQAIGLVHEVVPESDLDAAVDAILHELDSAGPEAIAAAKALIPEVCAASYDDSREITAHAIGRRRTTAEAQEGFRAFFERRPPTWSRR
jgi:methylglutaconyl-CoA hydratase